MSEKLPEQPEVLGDLTFLPRISQHDGLAIEDALGGRTLFDSGVTLSAAVVEAAYAASDQPLLKRLRETGVRQLVDPQTARFAGGRFLQVAKLSGLPYAPKAPIAVETFTPSEANDFARAVMRFEQNAGASWYVAAALPYLDDNCEAWIRHNDRLLASILQQASKRGRLQ